MASKPKQTKAKTNNNNFKAAQIADTKKSKRLIIDGIDYTPKVMLATSVINFDKLIQKVDPENLEEFQNKSHAVLAVYKDAEAAQQSVIMKTTIEDVVRGVSMSVVSNDDVPIWKRILPLETETVIQEKPKEPTYIKVYLRQTDEIVLFEKPSYTVSKDSDEAKIVEESNRRYQYLTVGKGRVRRTADGEAQTLPVLRKNRYVNTDKIKTVDVGTFVSNYDMYDTYAELEADISNNDKKPEFARRDEKKESDDLGKNANFKLAAMLTERILAGNIFSENQKRFRNMTHPDPMDLNVKYLYTLKTLWTYPPVSDERRAVSAMSWCPSNGDILAVAYGLHGFVPIKDRRTGYVCIWSIKNPVNPERIYKYSVPAITVEFSIYTPQLLAIGLCDGTVEIKDISSETKDSVAVSDPSVSSVTDPFTSFKWILSAESTSIDQQKLLAVSMDGSIMKYSIVNGPYLSGHLEMVLDRIVGSPEGLKVHRNDDCIEANRRAKAFKISRQPDKKDLYYVCTDEGCIHKCSTNYPVHHIDVLQAHQESIYDMDFSPWSPKVFLTCGSDWYIRIWLDGIFECLIELWCGYGPVHRACWSRTHSTIIISVIGSGVQVWDIRRSILKPVSFTKLENATTAKLSNCGRSIAIGDEDGQVHMRAFEDMPFPSYFQYQELENAIMKAIRSHPELTKEVQSMGFFGYPGKSKPKIEENENNTENK